MALPLHPALRHAGLLATQSLEQHLRVRKRDELICGAVHEHDAPPADAVAEFAQLRGALVVPPGRDSLADEALAGEGGGVAALGEFAGTGAVAVCGEELYDRFDLVWVGDPRRGEEVGFGVGDLDVD